MRIGTVAGWTAYSIARPWRTAGQNTYRGSLVPHTYTNQTTAGYTTRHIQGHPYASHSGCLQCHMSLLPLVTFASSSFALCRVLAVMPFPLTSSLPLVTQASHDSPVPTDTTSMSAPPMWVTLYPYLLTACWEFPCGLPSKPLQCQA